MNHILSLGLLTVLPSATTADSTCKVLDTTFLDVGKDGGIIQVVTEACTGLLSPRGPPWHHQPEEVDARQSCGVSCVSVCGPGIDGQESPPVLEHCQEIKDAIEDHFEDTFVLSPGQTKTMTYKTCSFSFTNDGPSDVEYCYSELVC